MDNVIYEDLMFDDYDEQNIIFDELFNNSYANKTYIITGDIGLWDGVRKDVHHPEFFSSIKSAILAANDGFDGYITVTEKSYGRLFVDISHHDGHNSLEIRELTKVGEEIFSNYGSVRDVIQNKKATKNVKYSKNYRC